MTWTTEEFLTLLLTLKQRNGDTTLLEIKRASGGMPQNLGETLCAFANMPGGGTIILGVDEKQGFEVTGIHDEAKLEAAIASHNRNDVVPAPHLEFETLIIDKSLNEETLEFTSMEPRIVLIVKVDGLGILDRPARYKNKPYLRQADGDYVMNDSELRMLAVNQLHQDERVRYDETPLQTTGADDLEEEQRKTYLENIKSSSRRLARYSDEEILRSTAVITDQAHLTLAGAYALGKYPQGLEPALTATAAVRIPGQSRSINLQDFDGPLAEMLEDMTHWVARNLPTYQIYSDDGQLSDVPVVPLASVREVLANALVHRDLGPDTLGLGKSIQIRITDRCLIVESPGGLRGISRQQLESPEHSQAAVNQRLYAMAKQLRTSSGARVIEGEGGGIREVLELAQRIGAPKPDFIDTGVKFKVILWFIDSDRVAVQPISIPQASDPHNWDKLGKNVPLLVRELDGGIQLSRAELAERTKLSSAQVRYALEALDAAGYLEMSGERGSKKTTYVLKP